MKKFVIDEDFLQSLERLEMLIKNNYAGMFGGNRKSKNYGSSCEFADYRDYMPGDDISKIDWNAYARFDKLYRKLYLDERQMHTKIYIDASRSMDYGEAGKAEQAIKLAAAIAYLSVAGMDKVSIYTVKDSTVEEVATMVGKEAFLLNIGKLNDISFSSDSFISSAIMPEKVGYGDGMSVIISDFLTDNDYEGAIDLLADKRRHTLCVQVLTPEEEAPAMRGKVHLFDSENPEKYYRKNIDREIARAYREAVAYVKNRIKDYCLSRGADYLFISSSDSLDEIFFVKMVELGVLK